MKLNSRMFALMAALAVGTAAAAPTTPAGQTISNTALASFDDPSNSNNSTSVSSNTVTTTTNGIANFDISYADGSNDGTLADGTTTPAAYIATAVLPGSNVTRRYTATNTGNIPNYVVNLSAVTGAGTGATAFANTNVVFYPTAADGNGDGTLTDSEIALADAAPAGDPKKAITSVTLPVDDANPAVVDNNGQVSFFQVIKVPTSVVAGRTYTASPQGSAASSTNFGGYAAVSEPANDLQYSNAVIFTSPVTVTPPTNVTTDDVPVPPTANPTGPVANPVNTPGVDPTDPKTPNTYPDPTNPTPTPTNPGTSILITGNDQIAYPPADTNTTPDKVTFNQVVNNPGAVNDTVYLFPTQGPSSGTPNAPIAAAYDTTLGGFTLPDGTIVKFLDNTGAPLPTAVNPADGKTYPILPVSAASSTPYRVEVTYPDSNPTVTSNPTPVVVTTGADSGNDSDNVANGSSQLTINPASANFGDSTTGTPSTITPAAPVQSVNVTGGVVAAGATPDSSTTTDRTATFPMTIVNNGEYNDTYTLGKPTVTIPNISGPDSILPVKYVYADGTELLKDANGNYVTNLVPANGNLQVFAVIDVPATAKGGDYTVPQSATGNYSTINITDTNDIIRVAVVNTVPVNNPSGPSSSTSGIAVGKYQKVGAVPTNTDTATVTVLPGNTLNYAIVAKNNFNADTRNFILSDGNTGSNNAFTYGTLQSGSVAIGGTYNTTGFPNLKVAYRYNSTGAWTFGTSSLSLAAIPAGVTSVQAAVDSNNDGVIDATDVLPAGATLTLNLGFLVK